MWQCRKPRRCSEGWRLSAKSDQGPEPPHCTWKIEWERCSAQCVNKIVSGNSTYSWPLSLSTPLNSYKCRLGGSHSTVPLKFNRSLVSSNPAVDGTPCRIFKFVSPSRLDVSINAIACGSLDDNRTKSAGKNALLIIRTMSPTCKFCHFMATHWPPRSVSTSRWLRSSSARCRFYNSIERIKIAREWNPWWEKARWTYEIFNNFLDSAYS